MPATANLTNVRWDVPYGDSPLQAVDVFAVADSDAPIPGQKFRLVDPTKHKKK